MHKTAYTAAIAALFFGTSLVGFPGGTNNGTAKEDNEEKAVELRAALDKSFVHPGDKVRIVETMPSAKQFSVIGHHHNVLYVGKVNRGTGRLKNLPSSAYHISPFTAFERGLPRFTNSTRPIDFTVKNPREIGFEFEFQANYLGIFLIEPRWAVHGHSGLYVYAPPVILTVAPPVDDNGKPIIKDEWIKD